MILFFTNSSSYLRHLFSPLVTGFVLLSVNVFLAALSFSLFSEHLSDGTSYSTGIRLLMPMNERVFYSSILTHSEINMN